MSWSLPSGQASATKTSRWLQYQIILKGTVSDPQTKLTLEDLLDNLSNENYKAKCIEQNYKSWIATQYVYPLMYLLHPSQWSPHSRSLQTKKSYTPRALQAAFLTVVFAVDHGTWTLYHFVSLVFVHLPFFVSWLGEQGRRLRPQPYASWKKKILKIDDWYQQWSHLCEPL